MIRVSQVKVPLEHTKETVRSLAAKKIRVSEDEIRHFEIIKQSLDARTGKRSGHEGTICYQYTVALSLKDEKKVLKRRLKDVDNYRPAVYKFPYRAQEGKDYQQPVIVGTGPAGLFCGLMLARAGFRPILLERGCDVHTRLDKVNDFWENKRFDPECNVQFGEGGAGTFSDGKLNTLVKDPTGRHRAVLETFVQAGAPEDILYVQKPHIGTDLLVDVVKNIRQEIISFGGEVRFNACLTGICIKNGHIDALEINHQERLAARNVVLAIGHSARDTYQLLYDQGMNISPKAFAIGVRIEHPQEMIDQAQYGADHPDLPASPYKLTYKAENGRNVYTFCMCPGGYVVNASSEKGGIVVNGMSLRGRDSGNANSAVIVNVTPEDFGSSHPLAGVLFQRKWEQLAMEEGRGDVPVQLFADFKAGRVSGSFGQVLPVHKGAIAFGDLNRCLPEYVCDSLKEGIEAFGRKIKGFNRDDALLSGVETRSSSPIRMERGQTLESNICGLFPCGEGAGYAGGITSAAMDGIRVAEAVAASLIQNPCPDQEA